jgi:16S rRNA (guanine527-N7)-methyltransferase
MANQSKSLSPIELAHWRLEQFIPDLPGPIMDKIRLFHVELINFNSKLSLISSRTETDADLVHITDGVLGSRIVIANLKHQEVFDIGSGNGVPGIILAVLAPHIRVNLVDVDGRKVEFLKHVISKCDLKNCKTILSRFEELNVGSIGACVSRGFAPLARVMVSARKVMVPGGEYYHFKGTSWVQELTETPSQALAAWNVENSGDYYLPLHQTKLSIIKITKR